MIFIHATNRRSPACPSSGNAHALAYASINGRPHPRRWPHDRPSGVQVRVHIHGDGIRRGLIYKPPLIRAVLDREVTRRRRHLTPGALTHRPTTPHRPTGCRPTALNTARAAPDPRVDGREVRLGCEVGWGGCGAASLCRRRPPRREVRRAGRARGPSACRVIGGAALLLGVLVYLADRRGGSAVWLPSSGAWSQGARIAGTAGAWAAELRPSVRLRSFMVALRPRHRRAGASHLCAAWWVVNVVFELNSGPRRRSGSPRPCRPVSTGLANARALANLFRARHLRPRGSARRHGRRLAAACGIHPLSGQGKAVTLMLMMKTEPASSVLGDGGCARRRARRAVGRGRDRRQRRRIARVSAATSLVQPTAAAAVARGPASTKPYVTALRRLPGHADRGDGQPSRHRELRVKRSSDGGNTFVAIADASARTYALASVNLSDDGAVFRPGVDRGRRCGTSRRAGHGVRGPGPVLPGRHVRAGGR